MQFSSTLKIYIEYILRNDNIRNIAECAFESKDLQELNKSLFVDYSFLYSYHSTL